MTIFLILWLAALTAWVAYREGRPKQQIVDARKLARDERAARVKARTGIDIDTPDGREQLREMARKLRVIRGNRHSGEAS